jgi:predicted Ser/Thr protein kinase
MTITTSSSTTRPSADGSRPITARTLQRARVLRWIGVLAFVLCMGLFLYALPARFQQLAAPVPDGSAAAVYQAAQSEADILASYAIPMEAYALYHLIFETLQVSAFVAMAALLFVQRGSDPMALFTAIWLILIGTMSPATVFARVDDPLTAPLFNLLQAARYVLPVFFLYLFPNGRFVPAWTRSVAVVWLGLVVLVLLIFRRVDELPSALQVLLMLLWLGPGIGAQSHRFRHVSSEDQRQQTRWFLFGLLIVVAASIARALCVLLFPALSQPGEARLLFVGVFAVPLLDTLAFLALPVTLAIAMARYRLYGLSLVINRSLVAVLLLAALLLAFVVGFFVLQAGLQLIGGSTTAALVIAAAICAALFDPARRAAQRVIDRHLFGLRVDLNQLGAARAAHEQALTLSASFSTAPAIPGYDLDGLIGRGGMGQVYRARHRMLGRTVAIKLLPESNAQNEEFRLRFEREARIVAGLKHPHIVAVYDFGVLGDAAYMVMEYIEGRDLGAHLKTRGVGGLPLPETAHIVAEVAAALDVAHAHGLVHRDIKPSNIMLQAGVGGWTRAVLTDFGIAKTDEDAELTRTGLIGTLDYIAPEQIISARNVDGRADIYALGVMTYYMIAGQLPFLGGVGEVVFAHLQQPPPDPRRLRPELPRAAADAVLQALAKSADDRYPTAGAFAAAYVGALAGIAAADSALLETP